MYSPNQIPIGEVDPTFPPQYTDRGILCKPSVLDPVTKDWRMFDFDFEDNTRIEPMRIITIGITSKFSKPSIDLCREILGGKIKRDEIYDGQWTWNFPGMSIGEATQRIVETNEKVTPELRLSVPYAQEFNGYDNISMQKRTPDRYSVRTFLQLLC